MLRKLMRYDFRDVLRLWWIPAVTLLAMAPLTGLFIYLPTHVETTQAVAVTLSVIMGLLIFLYILTFAAAIGLSAFFCYRRFYCHFFTDEGYLTFTLPVKRRTLLLSKTLVIFVVFVATALTCAASLSLLAVTSGYAENVFGLIGEVLKSLFEGQVAFGVLVAFEAAVLLVLLLGFYQLLVQFAVTLGAVVAKKHKILAAIGFYYLASNVLELLLVMFVQFFSVFTTLAAVRFAENMSAARFDGVMALLILMGILLFAMIDTILYLLTLSSIERRLNLA